MRHWPPRRRQPYHAQREACTESQDAQREQNESHYAGDRRRGRRRRGRASTRPGCGDTRRERARIVSDQRRCLTPTRTRKREIGGDAGHGSSGHCLEPRAEDQHAVTSSVDDLPRANPLASRTRGIQ